MNPSEYDDKEMEDNIKEDYFFGEDEAYHRSNRIFALVIYDIVENKKRARFSKFMQSYGTRIQKSSFEISVERKKFERLLKLVPRFCKDEDSIRVYQLSSKTPVYKFGKDDSITYEDILVI